MKKYEDFGENLAQQVLDEVSLVDAQVGHGAHGGLTLVEEPGVLARIHAPGLGAAVAEGGAEGENVPQHPVRHQLAGLLVGLCQALVLADHEEPAALPGGGGHGLATAYYLAKEHGIRVFYYIAPKVWAWREWRVKAIRKYVDELFIIFPFERDYFPKHGIRPIFEGNPLVDAIEARRASLPSPDEFRRRHALDERPIVALLAGSRRSEIKANLPLMADLARKFPDRQFVVTGVSWLDRSIYEQYIADSGIRYVCDQTYETLAAAEAAVVTSGTATLETALLNVPEVVVYRTLWFQVKLQPYVLKVPYVSLVNLNLGRESVVEIIQSDLDITRAERELRAILTGGEKRERMLRDFAEKNGMFQYEYYVDDGYTGRNFAGVR